MRIHKHCGTAALAAVLAVGLAGPWSLAGAQSAGALPDVLGITIGMAPQKAYELLKAHDPAHVVALEQTTIPQLYGDKPIAYGMSPTTTGVEDQIAVALTMPPNPQVVWQVHRAMGRFASTRDKIFNALHEKYGTPWNPYPASPPNPHAGVLQWFFDEQGHPVMPTAAPQVMALKNCMSQMMGFWTFDGIPIASWGASATTLSPGRARTAINPVPPFYETSKFPACNNLVEVQVVINGGGTVNDGDLAFSMDFTISDYDLQHRSTNALNAALNDIVQHGISREQHDAQQQAVPKM